MDPTPDEPTMNIVETAQNTDILSTLVQAVVAADLVDTLSGPGPFTVFAPTNEAFAALGSTVDDLLKPENKDQLVNICVKINQFVGVRRIHERAVKFPHR